MPSSVAGDPPDLPSAGDDFNLSPGFVWMKASPGWVLLTPALTSSFSSSSVPAPPPSVASTTLDHFIEALTCDAREKRKKQPGKWASKMTSPSAMPSACGVLVGEEVTHSACELCDDPLRRFVPASCRTRGVGPGSGLLEVRPGKPVWFLHCCSSTRRYPRGQVLSPCADVYGTKPERNEGERTAPVKSPPQPKRKEKNELLKTSEMPPLLRLLRMTRKGCRLLGCPSPAIRGLPPRGIMQIHVRRTGVNQHHRSNLENPQPREHPPPLLSRWTPREIKTRPTFVALASPLAARSPFSMAATAFTPTRMSFASTTALGEPSFRRRKLSRRRRCCCCCVPAERFSSRVLSSTPPFAETSGVGADSALWNAPLLCPCTAVSLPV